MNKTTRFLFHTALIDVLFGSVAFGGCGASGGKQEDYAAITAVTPTDGKIVSLANDDLGDFCAQSLFDGSVVQSYVTHTDNYAPMPVTLKFKSEENASNYVIRLATDKNFSKNVLTYEADGESVIVENLWVNTKYFWQVEATMAEGNAVSPTFTFKTALTPRTVWWEGVSNTRDIGGYPLQQGGQLAQGKVYRGGLLNEITETGKAAMKAMGVKTIFDLRSAGDNGAGDGSPVEGIAYLNISDYEVEEAPYYEIFTDTQRDAMGKILRVFADADNYPVYFHCSLGRDRTGTLAYLLGALVGVESDYLKLDYLTSAFSVRGTWDTATYSNLEAQIDKMFFRLNAYYEGETFAAKVAHYATDCGLTEAEIAAIRQNLTA